MRIHGRLNPGVDIKQANALVSATVAGLAQRYPASNEFKSATVEPYASMGAAGSPEIAPRRQRPAQPGGSGAADRVPEHLRHDAGPRRQPRARAVDSRGARRGPAALDPASVLRSDPAGVRRRRAQRVRAVRHSRRSLAGIWASPVPEEIDFDATSVADRVRTVPGRERALRLVAGGSFQPSQPDSRAEGGCRRRRTPDHSRASHRGDGADRHRRAISRRSAA